MFGDFPVKNRDPQIFSKVGCDGDSGHISDTLFGSGVGVGRAENLGFIQINIEARLPREPVKTVHDPACLSLSGLAEKH